MQDDIAMFVKLFKLWLRLFLLRFAYGMRCRQCRKYRWRGPGAVVMAIASRRKWLCRQMI